MNCSLCGNPSDALDDGSRHVRPASFVILNPGPGLAPGTVMTVTVRLRHSPSKN
jgi:hypothetical protein